MRAGIRQVVSVVAVFAIALHTVLWGAVAPLADGPAIDPFSVICHSAAPTASPTDQSPASPASAPTHACDHCNFCSVTSPLAALDTAPSSRLSPVRLLQVLRPVSVVARSHLATTPHLARGPPAFA